MEPVNSIADRLSQFTVMTDEQEEQWFFQSVICDKLEAGGIPKRFWQEFTVWPEKAQEMVFHYCMGMLEGKGAIIALVGKRGTGKTSLAAQIMIKLIRFWHTWHFQTASQRTGKRPIGLGQYRKLIEVVAKMKANYSDFGSIQAGELDMYRDRLVNCGLLILDEKHDADEMKATDRILTDLIDRRYSAKKDSIIISNQTEEEFKATTSDSVLSRISEHGVIIPCEWGSFRAKVN